MSESNYVRGEILPPLPKSPQIVHPSGLPAAASEEHLNLIASWLDDRFQIPGTRIRFGLDAVIGWIPGIGDALAAIASLFIVFSAWQRGAQRITILRMMFNLAIEDTLGAIPIIGDIAHVAWKANRRNYNLLMRDQQSTKRHTWQDWLFVVVAALIMLVLFLAPFVLLAYLLKSQRPLY